jgi:hypothetical protein
MSYPPNTTSLLAMLNTTGAKFIEQQGHTALHKAMRANAAAGIVSAAAAVETVSKLDAINESFVTLGDQIAAGEAANAQLAEDVALLKKKAERLEDGLDRLRARDHEYAHAIGFAHRFVLGWLQKYQDEGPTLALGLADASHFWLVQAPRMLEDVDVAGETIWQRIEKINLESARFDSLVKSTADYASSCGLSDFTMTTGASLQLGSSLDPGATEHDARREIARLAGLALWLFAMVALTDPLPASGVQIEPGLSAPVKGKTPRRAA